MSTAFKIYTPDEAAALLRISVRTLVELLRVGDYDFADFAPAASKTQPWGRGRKVWGLTQDQLDAIVVGQTRRFPKPSDAPGLAPKSAFLPGHDGISRIREVKPRRKKPGPVAGG